MILWSPHLPTSSAWQLWCLMSWLISGLETWSLLTGGMISGEVWWLSIFDCNLFLFIRLNEGFASYMEYKGVANYHPDWEMDSQFLTMDLHRVMDLDATINSHPIVQEVAHPDQITEIFDTISYAKGASVLRMLEQFMGSSRRDI